MTRAAIARRIALGVFSVVIFVGQIRQTADLLYWLRHPDTPFTLPVAFDWDNLKIILITSAKDAGDLRVGDVIVSFRGREVRGVNDLFWGLAREAAGAKIALGYMRGAERRETVITPVPPQTAGASSGAINVWMVSTFISTWGCLLLGFFVAARRPDDRLAWMLLLLLLGVDSINPIMGSEAHWGPGWSSLYRFLSEFFKVSWAIWMLWFGLDFPDPQSPRRLAGFMRWPLTLVLGAYAFLDGLEAAWQLVDIRSAAFVSRAAHWFDRLEFWLPSICMTLFFANIGYKAGTERQPDAKRRLRLLLWGGQVSLTPMFVLLLVLYVFRGTPPIWAWVACASIMVLFPATLAYVILVERAMDVGVVVRLGLQHALAAGTINVLRVALVAVGIYLCIRVALSGTFSTGFTFAVIAAITVTMVLMRHGADRLRRWVDRRFFREQVETERVLAELSHEVLRIADTHQLIDTVANRLREALHVEDVRISLNGEQGGELSFPLLGAQGRVGTLILGPKKSEAPYSPSDRRLLESVAAQTALAIENSRLTMAVASEAAERERIARELEIAREVQQRLLPRGEVHLPGFEICGRCRPAQEVGGDYYDFQPLPGPGVGCSVGDVAGKGVPAALLMACLQSSLRALQVDGVRAPGEMLEKLNSLIYAAIARNRFATMFYAAVDASRRVRYASAGHPAAVLARAGGGVERLTTRGPALGLQRSASYHEAHVTMEPGDALLLYSDGFSEAMNPAREEFGEERLARVFSQLHCRPAEGILEGLLLELESWSAGAAQHDDMTLIVVKALS